MNREARIFWQPLGSMCITCVHRLRRCDWIPFERFRKHSTYELGGVHHIEVVCQLRKKDITCEK